MKQFSYTIKTDIRSQQIGQLVKLVKTLDSAVSIEKLGGTPVFVSRQPIAFLKLGLRRGDSVTVTIEGGHEEDNLYRTECYFTDNL